MHSHRRHAVVLVLVLGLVALVAQLAGVGARRPHATTARISGAKLATIVGGTVPDRGSTTLQRTSIRARDGETVRMTGVAHLKVAKLGRRATAQVVCGLRYSRDGDAAWTLGTPYENVTLASAGAVDEVHISRSFDAPANDTYRMSVACHVFAPGRGADVRATGTMRASLGLPTGAAIPVD